MKRIKRIDVLLKILIVFLFISGVIVFFYPFLSDAVNTFYASKTIESIAKENKEQFLKEKQDRIKKEKEQSKAATDSVIGLKENLFDVNEDELTSLTKEEFQAHLIGQIYIPKIKVVLPIFDETTDQLLDQGATLLQGTSYPSGGKSTHSVITGHSGLASQLLFTNLDELKEKDYFLVDNFTETLKYEVIEIKTVLPTETKDLVIQEDKDLMTLLTCTPYMINTHRLLVTGKRVAFSEEQAKKEIKQLNQNKSMKFYLLIVTAIVIIILFIWWVRSLVTKSRKQRKRKRNGRK